MPSLLRRVACALLLFASPSQLQMIASGQIDAFSQAMQQQRQAAQAQKLPVPQAESRTVSVQPGTNFSGARLHHSGAQAGAVVENAGATNFFYVPPDSKAAAQVKTSFTDKIKARIDTMKKQQEPVDVWAKYLELRMRLHWLMLHQALQPKYLDWGRISVEATYAMDLGSYEIYAEWADYVMDMNGGDLPLTGEEALSELQFAISPTEHSENVNKMMIRGPIYAIHYFRLRAAYHIMITHFETDDEPMAFDCLNELGLGWSTGNGPYLPDFSVGGPLYTSKLCMKLYYMAGYGGEVGAMSWGKMSFRGCDFQRTAVVILIIRAWLCEESWKRKLGMINYWVKRAWAPNLALRDSFHNRLPEDGHAMKHKAGAVQTCFDLYRDTMAGNEYGDDFHITRSEKIGPNCLFTHLLLTPFKKELIEWSIKDLEAQEDADGKKYSFAAIPPEQLMPAFNTKVASGVLMQFIFERQAARNLIEGLDCPIDAVAKPPGRFSFVNRYPRRDCNRGIAEVNEWSSFAKAARAGYKEFYGVDNFHNAKWVWLAKQLDNWELADDNTEGIEKLAEAKESLIAVIHCKSWDETTEPCIATSTSLYFDIKELCDLTPDHSDASVLQEAELLMEVVQSVAMFISKQIDLAYYATYEDITEVEKGFGMEMEVKFKGDDMCETVDDCVFTLWRWMSGNGANIKEQLWTAVVPGDIAGTDPETKVAALSNHMEAMECMWGCTTFTAGLMGMVDQNWFAFIKDFIEKTAPIMRNWLETLKTFPPEIQEAVRDRFLKVTKEDFDYNKGNTLSLGSVLKFIKEMTAGLRLTKLRRRIEEQYPDLISNLETLRTHLTTTKKVWSILDNMNQGKEGCHCSKAKEYIEEEWTLWYVFHGFGEIDKNVQILPEYVDDLKEFF